MSDAKDQHEPSMEEILASIRRIISEDDESAAAGDTAAAAPGAAPPPPTAPAAGAPSAAPQAAAPSPRPSLIADGGDDDDVLILTEEVKDDAVVVHEPEAMPLAIVYDEEPPEPVPEPVAEPESEPALELDDDLPDEPAPDFVRASAERLPQLAADEDDRLLSDRATAASLASLSELITRSHRDPEIESLHMGNADRTLEDITRELLRPILKSWLDENLPQIVERVVREEIGRLALDAQRR